MPDNNNLTCKVVLRLHALQEAAISEARVLDLYAGRGLVWESIKKSVNVAAYVACDRRKLRPGQICFNDSSRLVKAFDIIKFNVIDVDTYGEPWEAFEDIYKRIAPGSLLFLTHGISNYSVVASNFARSKMGIPVEWDIPKRKQLTLIEHRWFLNPEHHIIRLWKTSSRGATYFAALF